MTSSATGARPTRAQVLGLVAWLALAFLTGALGARASVGAAGFYATLERPAWSPPAGVFGPVWSVLYATMGIAAWLVWRTGPRPGVSRALAIFVAHLGVNALWSWLFFAWRLGALSFAGATLLTASVAATVVAFRRVSPLAALLLAPYLAWVTFATLLTWSLWRANPALLG